MDIYFGGALVLGAFVWFFCAYLCYMGARQRNRTPLNWGILGIVFGPIALFALYLMPHGHSTESKPTAGGHQAPHGNQSQTQADLYEVPKHKKD